MARVHKFAQKKYQIESEAIALYGKTLADFTYNDLPVMGQGGVTDVVLATVGSTPNANGATISGTTTKTLALQPASGTQPGIITAGSQSIGGDKSFSGFNTFGGTTSFAGLAQFNANVSQNTGTVTLSGTTNVNGPFTATNSFRVTQPSSFGSSSLSAGMTSVGIHTFNPSSFGKTFSVNAGTDGEWDTITLSATDLKLLQVYNKAPLTSGASRSLVVNSVGSIFAVPNTAYTGVIAMTGSQVIPTAVGSIITPTWASITPANPIVTFDNSAPGPTLSLLNRGVYTFITAFQVSQTTGTSPIRIFAQFLQGTTRASLAAYTATSLIVGPNITGVENCTTGSEIIVTKTTDDGTPLYLAMKLLASTGDTVTINGAGGIFFRFSPTA